MKATRVGFYASSHKQSIAEDGDVKDGGTTHTIWKFYIRAFRGITDSGSSECDGGW
jgi:hypothetical protein